MKGIAAIILGAMAMSSLTDALATVFCAGSSAAIHDALLAAENNGADDEVRIVSGTYQAAGTGFGYATGEDRALAVSGGWEPTCTLFSPLSVRRPSYRFMDGDPMNAATNTFVGSS